MKKAHRIHIRTIITWLAFVFSLFLIWYLFIKKDWIPEVDQKLTFILGFFAVAFSVFQFIINNQKDNERYLNQIRLDEYRRIRIIFQDFIDTLNNGLSEIITPIEAENRLLNLRNELSVLMNTNNSRIFPNLKQQVSSKKIDELSEKILLTTSKIRVSYQKTIENELVKEIGMQNLKLGLLYMEWGNSVKDDLKELMEERTILLDYLQSIMGI
jgi:hypothetical protein